MLHTRSRQLRPPPFERFVRRSYTGATGLVAAMAGLLIGPFFAPSFAAFWLCWKPLYRYVLWYHVYVPLRRRVPRSWAAWLTFLICGAVAARSCGTGLHDLPWFCLSALCRGAGPGFPAGTVLFGVWGWWAEVSRRWERPRPDRSAWSCALRNVLGLCRGFLVTVGVRRLVGG